jgi:hypothetical protein
MRPHRIAALAAFALMLGLFVSGLRITTARATCDPAGGPCPPPKGERDKRATATDTRLALSNFSPTPTNTVERLCLQYDDWIKCVGNPNCQPVPPLCPSATPPATSTPTSTLTPTATPSPTPTSPHPTGTQLLCLDYEEFKKCIGNPQCQGIPLCPWANKGIPTATHAPLLPVTPGLSPLGPVPPLAWGIGGAVAVLAFALALARRYKDRS